MSFFQEGNRPRYAMTYGVPERDNLRSVRCEYCGSTCWGTEALNSHPCTAAVMAARAEKETRQQSMANIILCDRCGQIATARVAGGCEYTPNQDADRKFYGLCPNCSRELYDWLTAAEKDVRAIMAPFNPDDERTPQGPTQADTSRAALESEYGEGK